MFNSILLLAGMFLIASFPVHSQRQEWVNFSYADVVYSLVPDDNHVWAGTNSGLVKINIHNGKVTYLNKGNSRLPSNKVFSIAVDHRGVKWFGTSAGLVKIEKGQWTIFNTTNSALPTDSVTSLAAGHKSELWIGTENHGLVRFDGKSWLNYNSENSPLPYGQIGDITVGNDGKVWIAVQDQLMNFNGKDWNTIPLTDTIFYNQSVTSILFDKQNRLWVGTNYGLGVYSKGKWTQHMVFKEDRITSITVDRTGNVWAGCFGVPYMDYGGIAKFNGKNWRVFDKNNSGLKSNWVTALTSDKNGNIWIAAYERGIVKFTGKK